MNNTTVSTITPTACRLCPRECGRDRRASVGYCGGGDAPRVARAMLHKWEEPVLCGENGAGAVFFSGCPLRCVYCQNHEISLNNYGRTLSTADLAALFMRLYGLGAATLDLVTPTQYLPWIRAALEAVPALGLPVVMNSGGYERVETLRAYGGLFDIFLPDFKYADATLAARYSAAPDYPTVALNALREMCRQQPEYIVQNNVLRRGVLVRHLVLPGARRNTEDVLRLLKAEFGGAVRVSLMSQYTPQSATPAGFPELSRRVCTYEYQKALELCDALGLDGYCQSRRSAAAEYTPEFNGDLLDDVK